MVKRLRKRNCSTQDCLILNTYLVGEVNRPQARVEHFGVVDASSQLQTLVRRPTRVVLEAGDVVAEGAERKGEKGGAHDHPVALIIAHQAVSQLGVAGLWKRLVNNK